MMKNGSDVKVTATNVTLPGGSIVTGYNASGTTYMLGGRRPTNGSIVHTSAGDYVVTGNVGVKAETLSATTGPAVSGFAVPHSKISQ